MDLSGEELDDYCRNRGICKRCVKVVTHKRIVKLFGKGIKWEPLTVRKVKQIQRQQGDNNGSKQDQQEQAQQQRTTSRIYLNDVNDFNDEYSVYKGYCLNESICYTLAEAKRLLGETNPTPKRGRIKIPKRPGKRRMRANPETGSVSGNSVMSFSSTFSGFSKSSQATSASKISLSGMSSRFSEKFRGLGHTRNSKKKKPKQQRGIAGSSSHRGSSNSNSAASIDGSEITTDDLDLHFATQEADDADGTKIKFDASVSPIVAHRAEQLITNDYFVVLYLCKADLSTSTGSANIDAIVEALRKTKTLESITLEKCNLDDEGIEKLAGGLEEGGRIGTTHHYHHKKEKETEKDYDDDDDKNSGMLKTLRLKGNRIGNRGIRSLEFLFRSSSTLEELDLSDNCIGSKGAASVLESLGQNRSGIPLSILNLSQNEIWDLSGNIIHNTDDGVQNNNNSGNVINNGNDNKGNNKNKNAMSIQNNFLFQSFLHNNETLQELNLDGNCLHDEGAEYIAESLQINKYRGGILQKLHLGWNGIGDIGAIALAKALESSTTIRVLGLAENDITNSGARALLSALAVNVSMKEISGLYHNRIDRKFIIVAIKRLLHRTTSEEDQQQGDGMLDSSYHSEAASQIIDMVATAEESEEFDTTSSSSCDVEYYTKAIALSSEQQQQQKQHQHSRSILSLSGSTHPHGSGAGAGPSIALEAIENWDWGTFGVDEIERRYSEDADSEIDQFLKDIEAEELSKDGDSPLKDTNKSTAEISSSTRSNQKNTTTIVPRKTDRLVVFQAAPLAYFHRKSMQHHGVPLLDFGHEAEAIQEVFASSKHQNNASETNHIEVVFKTATQNNFHNFFAMSWSPVMHFSCYGNPDYIALENGFGYMQALPLDAMNKLVASAAATSHLEVVVVSSCHAQQLADAFLQAGVPRVVCLPRDATLFRDEGPIDFARGFYGALGQSMSLREAFDAGIEECTTKASSSSQQQPLLFDSYKLLPEGADHDVEVFFQTPPPPMMKTKLPTDVTRDEDPMVILPKMPEQFFGREVDIYEILESLRVDDVIRIGGAPGSGKKSILSVMSRYILERSKSFQIDSVFWLPPPSGIIPDPDSLYGDLCMVFQWIIAAKDEIWDDEGYKNARQRILIEMEGRNSILVIDGRVFTNEIAGEMLERFLTYLLNEVNIKIILITAIDASRAKTKRLPSEETTIYLGPLDFQSTVKLYGNACPLIASVKGGESLSNFDSVEEFEGYLLPESSKAIEEVKYADSKTPDRSYRQNELYDCIGRGNPRDILERAISCTSDGLSDLLRIAQRPEVSITTSKELEEQLEWWIVERDHAIESKYYLRAGDIEKTLGELEDLKKIYPSLDDLKAKEADLKKQFSALLKAKRYDDANFVKRKILSLKRTMMKEKYSSSSSKDNRKTDALDSINEIQERMKTMMALAESMNASSTSVQGGEEKETQSQATFSVSEGCTLEISCGRLASFWKDSSSRKNAATIVWTNEACDFFGEDETMQQALGETVVEELSSIETLATTEWGSVRCATGDSVTVNAKEGCIVLAVPPLPPKHTSAKNDSSFRSRNQERLRYTETRLGSAIRSSFRNIRRNNRAAKGKGAAMVVGISTTTSLYGDTFREDSYEKEEGHCHRSLAVTLNTIVKELRRTKDMGGPNTKTTVRLFASSGRAESSELIKIASELGLQSLA